MKKKAYDKTRNCNIAICRRRLLLVVTTLVSFSTTISLTWTHPDEVSQHHSLKFTVPKIRNELGYTLEELGFKDGVEIGVQKGRFADKFILSQWTSFRSYRLVDLWGYQPPETKNYHDSANVHQQAQNRNFRLARQRLQKHANKTIFMRMSSLEAALQIPDASLDFAYVDARHDYCGVKEDIEAYWPKLRPGALMAGHDYVYAHEVAESLGNWSICEDGSVHPTAVRGAVDEFAEAHNLELFSTQEAHATWMFRKPFTADVV